MIQVVGSSNNDSGDLFAARMADLMHALGYNIDRMNLHKPGRELDIVATHRVEGRTAIAECKATQTPIGGSEINKFIGALDAERRKRTNETIGYFISLSGFKDSAIEQESELPSPRCILIGPEEISRELQNSKIIISRSLAIAAAQRAAENYAQATDTASLIATSIGWIWQVGLSLADERTAYALIHADGFPISPEDGGPISRILEERLKIPANRYYSAAKAARTTSSRLLGSYRQSLLAEVETVTHEGLPADATVGASLKLEELYIPLSLEFRRDDRLITREPSGADPDTNAVVRTSLAGALQESRHIALLGGPGSGKSTLLRRLSLAYADTDNEFIQSTGLPSDELFPVLVRCRDITDSEPNIQAMIEQSGSIFSLSSTERALFAEAVADLLRKGSAIILIDGLDEIASTTQRSRFVSSLRSFLSTYPGNYLIVSSREAGFRPVAGALAESCTRYKISDLTQSDIQHLVEKWNNLVPYTGSNTKRSSSALAGRILGNDRVRRLATNPLLLTTILLVERWVGDLPRKRSVLYDKAIEVLLITWNVEGHAPLDLDEVLPQLAYVAHSMTTSGSQRITSSQLSQLLGKARRDMPDVVALSSTTPRKLVERIELRSSLLVQSGFSEEDGRLQATYEFKHLTFQEYLTALACANGWTPEGLPISNPRRVLGVHYSNPTWQQIISLTAALAGRSATKIVSDLVSRIQQISDRLSQLDPKQKRWESTLDELISAIELLELCLEDEVPIHPGVARTAIQTQIEEGTPFEPGLTTHYRIANGRYGAQLRQVVSDAFKENWKYSPTEYIVAAAEIYEADLNAGDQISDKAILSTIREHLTGSDAEKQAMACAYLGMIAARLIEAPEMYESDEEFVAAVDAVDQSRDLLLETLERAPYSSSVWQAAAFGVGRNLNYESDYEGSHDVYERALFAIAKDDTQAVPVIAFEILSAIVRTRTHVKESGRFAASIEAAFGRLRQATPAKNQPLTVLVDLYFAVIVSDSDRLKVISIASSLGIQEKTMEIISAYAGDASLTDH